MATLPSSIFPLNLPPGPISRDLIIVVFRRNHPWHYIILHGNPDCLEGPTSSIDPVWNEAPGGEMLDLG